MARPITYDPNSGRDYATNVTFTPDDAAKLIGMARTSRVSVREVIRYLVHAAEVDKAGRSVVVEQQIAAETEAQKGDSSLF